MILTSKKASAKLMEAIRKSINKWNFIPIPLIYKCILLKFLKKSIKINMLHKFPFKS